MADIVEANYETVTARCDHCDSPCVFSRADDFGDFSPVAGRAVHCFDCGSDFWIKGDTVNTAYEFLIDDAKDHFRVKRYMPAIASLAQAWEVFFAACATSTFVYRPFFATDPSRRRVDDLNAALRLLHDAMRPFTWFPLRNVALHLLLLDARPTTLSDSMTKIAADVPMFGREPSPRTLSAIADARRRQAAEGLLSLRIGSLRNDVVHKHAYRPRRGEVESCLTSELSILYRVKHRLTVGDFLDYQAGSVFGDDMESLSADQ